ncbi:Non-specific serine/threonine protein kinase protein [Dioscorea alata]|uniref:Non-specific serine/threonine protein kinase protein n=1 Tax=Dioscorea alata TaxID=55571 RepID=A0ACB7WR11_DIOAL|nr:Non-specific serine/threonine protein kinase protein [Dioscorea alata]
MRSLVLPLLLLLFPLVLFGEVVSLPINQEILALGAFKRSIFEDPLSVLSDWNSFDENPCGWSGVTCLKPQNRVVNLILSNSSLKGFLAPELGLLDFLQELVLSNNLFLGSIPKEIGLLKNLTVLDLSSNQFSGPVPAEIGDLTSVTKIDLHSNGLTGGIPLKLWNLANLVELRLDRNKLSGKILGTNTHGMTPSYDNRTGLCGLTSLKFADFSYNFFVGKIPPCLKYLPRVNFRGNCFQDKESIKPRSTEQCYSVKSQAANEPYEYSNVAPEHRRPHQPKWLLILEITTGVVMLIFVITCVVSAIKICKRKSSGIIPIRKQSSWKDEISISVDSELLKSVLRFSRQELEVACEDFSNIIWSSTYSKVYKGTMKNGSEIAVLSFSISENQWTTYFELQFQNEVADFARLNNENIAKLLGYCRESEPFSRMLVFEYASNGTLYEHLHYGEGCQFSWLRRMKIAIGIARGLKYLHTELQPAFTISELNSGSVYLTEDFSPKLVDFERWKTIVSKADRNGSVANGLPYHGFMDSIERRHMDVQGNTFAFGMLLLELISGRPSYCGDRGCSLDWAMEYLQKPEKMTQIIEPHLKNVKSDDLSVVCSTISLCIEPEASKRPSMEIITAMLEDGIETSPAALYKNSHLAWAELALTS